MSNTNTESVNGKKRVLRQELPVDVVEEILLRLPAEHLQRYKVLSKTYYELITNPNFINKHLHLHQHSRNTNLAVMNKSKDSQLRIMKPGRNSYYVVFKPPGPYPLLRHYKEIVGSCNGLLCIQLTSKKGCMSHTLWNPTTRETFKIRSPKLDRRVEYYSSHGFGYDARCGGDYKLVKIVEYDSPSQHLASQIWSLKTNQWTEIGHVLPGRVCHKHKVDPTGLLVRNKLYWLARPSSDPFKHILFSYNMSTDTFGEVKMPNDFILSRYWRVFDMALNNFMGSLAIFIPLSPKLGGIPPYGVWVMDDNDNSWTMKLSTAPPYSKCLMPTRVSINGNFVMYRRGIDRTSAEFYFYGPDGNKGEGAVVRTHYEVSYDITLWSFTGSLVSINKHYNLNQQSSTRKRSRQGQPVSGRTTEAEIVC